MPLYSFRSSSVAEKRSMVGVDDVLLQMKEKLVSDWRDLQTIPVVGMGGTGKTTLAINIYQDRLIKEHFDIRAWATISQEYSIPEILVEILRGLKLEGDKQLSEDELGEILYKYLFGRRYLIVMDDMWSIEAWDGIRRFLPDRGNGSRIVVTTRLSDLASKLSNSNIIKMELLDETSSWDLLSEIVFGEEGCPIELEEIGKEIGKSCKGLPLSIVVIGGFLAKSAHTVEFWKDIKQNLSLKVNLEDYERCLEILYMSYKQLPIYLKPCFLYLGVFPEDDAIKISTLVKLWVAEGFLKPVSGGPTLEEIGRVYLKDLADRNLILIHEMSFKGNIKRCKIHDLLRDSCLREAEKERFYTLTCRGMLHGKRRIVINNAASEYEFINALPFMSRVRSLTWGANLGKKSSGTVSLSSQINFPHLLKKLCLTIDESENWDQDLLDKIGSLPFLQKLRLISGRFKDGKWETTEGQFLRLKVLELFHCKNLQVWTIESSHFPCLGHLLFYGAAEVLEEFPLDIAEVSTLREIEVFGDCTDSAVDSLKTILEENEEINGYRKVKRDKMNPFGEVS